MRKKDYTPVKCQLCTNIIPACGMGSHLYHKHSRMTSDNYVSKFGEFRRSKILLNERKSKSEAKCQLCNETLVSHKSLLTHIRKVHKVKWEDYFVKYFFNNEWPLCQCGCGERVKLIRNGLSERGEKKYAREFLSGHNTKTRLPGYRKNTQKQKETMRKSAIRRMKKKKGSYFEKGPSKMELELHEYIKGLAPDAVFNDREVLSGLELDIFLPKKNIAIEFNGSHFHNDLHKDKNYHLKKTVELQEKGVKLIHIWDTDWYLKQNIVKSIISNFLGYTELKVYARKTELRELSKKESTVFLSDNHLQGSSVDNIRLGLFYNNELVSVMTFSKLRRAVGRSSKEGSYEITRFCNKINTTVVGGASKLFKYFIETYKPNYILSFANRDWSTGELYESLGMKFTGYTKPGYFYVKSRHKFSRFQFQKHKLIEQGEDPSKTEYEIMLERGYVRVWDTGNYRFELFLDN